MRLSGRNAIALMIALTLVGGLLTVSDTWAQEKHKYFFKTPPGVSKYTKYTKLHVIDVGDCRAIRFASSSFTEPTPPAHLSSPA